MSAKLEVYGPTGEPPWEVSATASYNHSIGVPEVRLLVYCRQRTGVDLVLDYGDAKRLASMLSTEADVALVKGTRLR